MIIKNEYGVEETVYSNLEEMFAAASDEDGVIRPKGPGRKVDLDGPVYHLWCGKYFTTLREFLADERCKTGECNPLPADK
jgi:hypothetical protein